MPHKKTRTNNVHKTKYKITILFYNGKHNSLQPCKRNNGAVHFNEFVDCFLFSSTKVSANSRKYEYFALSLRSDCKKAHCEPHNRHWK